MDNEVDKRMDALREFMQEEKKVVTNELREIIKDIAKKGRYIYQWEYLKPLYSHELEQVMDNFLENFPPKNANGTDDEKVLELRNERRSILETFNSFASAPFTIQRLSELIIQPRKHYKTCAKFFRGLNKNLLVVSTVDPEESDTIDFAESDKDESPAKKMRLATEGESTAEAVGDQNQPENGHSLPTAQANGDDNEIESFNADLEKAVKQGHENETENSNSKAFDADGSVTVGTEVKKQEKQQRIDGNEVEDRTEVADTVQQETGETKDDVRKASELNAEQSSEQKTDLSHSDTPL